MSGEEDNIEVVVTPDENEVKDDLDVKVIDDDEVVKASDDDDDDSDPRKAIEKLQKKLKKEKQARKEAERRANEASAHVYKANVEVEDTNMHLVTNAMDTLKRDNEILTANYAELMRNGEYEEAARVQTTINQNDLNLNRLQEGYARMAEEAKNRPPPPPPPVATEDKVDQIIASVTPESARWLKQNRDYLKDDRSIRKMFNAHEEAIDDGIKADTQEYFAYIENRLGIKREEREEESPMSSAAKPAPRKAPPPPAPVNRQSNGRTQIAHLTRAEAEIAKSWGMTEKEYALHKIALQKEGRLTN